MALANMPASGNPGDIITTVRDVIAADVRAFTDPDVKAWCRRRWRHLFLDEAVKDPVAVEVASKRGDRRPLRQRVAERFLVGGAADWQDEQPAVDDHEISNTTLLFCPGMLNGLLPVRAFRDNLPKVEERFSMRVLRADSNPLGSCGANVSDIMKAFDSGIGLSADGHLQDDAKATPPGKVMLLAYSKGGPDIITALAAHPELAAKISCIFLWSSPVLGSVIADDIIKRCRGHKRLARNAGAISKSLKGMVPGRMKTGERAFRRSDEFDIRGCTMDVSTETRQAFMDEHAAMLDGLNVPMFSIGAATQKSEVPLIQRGGFRDLCKVDPQNDMQVPCNKAFMPLAMGIDLGIVHGHHWDVAYPAFVKRKWWNNMYHGFPKTAALVAMVLLASELGLID